MSISDDPNTLPNHALSLVRPAGTQEPVLIDEVREIATVCKRQNRIAHALERSAHRADLDPAEVAESFGYSAQHWGQIKGGSKLFDPMFIPQWNKCVGNTLVSRVIAYLSNEECRPLQSELERRALEAEAEAAELRKKLDWSLEVIAKVNGR